MITWQEQDGRLWAGVCLSTDAKPTSAEIPNGSQMVEMDTTNVFMYDAANSHWAGGNNDELTSIAVTTAPKKTTYAVGEAFDPTGLLITATWKDSSTSELKSYTLSGASTSTSGTKTVTVTASYGGGASKTATFTITVS